MSHPKDDIDETRSADSGLAIVDLLYGDLSDEEREATIASMAAADPSFESDLEEFTHLRALFQALPQEEPPASVTAKLMHAAAQHAPKPANAEGEEGKTGILAFLTGLFRPIALYPGLAAAASMVLILLVGGTLYMNGKPDGLGEPEVVDPVDDAFSPQGGRDFTLSGEAADPAASEAMGDEGGLGADRSAGQMAYDRVGDSAGLGGGLAAKEDASDDLGNPFEGSLGATEKADSSKKRARKSASRSKGAYYGAGDGSISSNGYRSTGSIGSASGRGMGNAPVVVSKSKSSASQAPSPKGERQSDKDVFDDPGSMDLEADDDRAEAEEAPQVPPQAPAKKAAPRPSSEPSPAEEPARDSSATSARVRSLHSEARIAAKRGDCKSVVEAGRMIRTQDATYYNRQFLTDPAIKPCLTSTSRQ